jgi:hypothetical protein
MRNFCVSSEEAGNSGGKTSGELKTASAGEDLNCCSWGEELLYSEAEVGGSATCSAMRIYATCATRNIAADVRFKPQSADCGIALAH